MKLFKNRFFIIALSVAIFISVLIATLSVMGELGALKDALYTVTSPFRYVGGLIRDAADGYGRYFQNMEELIAENDRLESENESLEAALADAALAEAENAVLREYLETKKKHPELELTDALVIGKENESFITLLTLNRGSRDGIAVGMPVISPSGLVGSISEVSETSCTVKVISEASAGCGAYIPRSGETCILSGDISLSDTGLCKLEYFSSEADVAVGDEVFTSGEGSGFPRDLFIGCVESVEVNEFSRTLTAYVRCAADTKDLKYLMIVTGY